MPTKYYWPDIQIRWEAGETAYQIAKGEGMPTPQAINQRAKLDGWVRSMEDLPEISHSLPAEVLENLRDNQVQVLRYISQGQTQKTAGQLVGVSEQAISRWKKEDKHYKLAHNVAVGVKKMNRLQKVENSTDTRDARWLLERDPDSRDEYGQNHGHKFIGNTWNVLADIDLGIKRD